LANFESGLDGLVPAQVANGCHSVDFPTDRANLLVVERRNACFDFGAWGAGLRAADAAGVRYAFVVFLNASVRGPFLPAYERRPWWRVFADELRRRDGPALLGTTFHCMDLSEHDARSAHVQSMVLAANASTLQKFRTYFFDGCPEDKADAIYGGELPLSRAILEEGLELGALALAHGRSPRLRLKPGARLAATCSAIRDATELNLGDTYFPAPGLPAPDVSPLEVVFFKTARSGAHRGALDRLARWAYFHAGLGEDAIDADYALPALRGEGPCAEAHWPVAQKDADARAADRKAELEGALREANAALSEAGAEVTRLKRALAGAVYL